MPASTAIALLDSTSWSGDRSMIEPVLLILHVLAILWCWHRAVRSPVAARPGLGGPGSDNVVRRTWWMLAAALTTLAACRLSGVLPQLTHLGRDFAAAQGWYETRRPVQAVFLLAMLVALAITAGLIARGLRHQPPTSRLAAVAAACLLGLLVMRAVSLHQVEHLVGVQLGGLTVDRLAELAAVVAVILAASRSA
ncbi:MAG: hypothetical protein ACYTGG_11920, partial [Planctomycetota bacterium]